ncbi:hypothetical protein SedNR2807_10510 [Citrobacter sedlakii]
MPEVSDEKKVEVRNYLSDARRPYQHTSATGVVLYDDGEYGSIHYGYSGAEVDWRYTRFVFRHRTSDFVRSRKKSNDAEVKVFDLASWEIISNLRERYHPIAMFLYVVGPHPVCPCCNHLKSLFKHEFSIETISVEYIQRLY